MYDTGKIITGLIIFLLLITFPIWYNVVSGKATYRPEPELPTKEKQCVAPRQYMRDNHMKLVKEWRSLVVREGKRLFVAFDGDKYDMSLTRTCLKCHPNKEKFCDQCHNYVAVTPNCWKCHVVPKESG